MVTAFFLPWDKAFEFPLSLELCNISSIIAVGAMMIRAYYNGKIKSIPTWALVLVLWLALGIFSGFFAANFGSTFRRTISYAVLICTCILVSDKFEEHKIPLMKAFVRGCIMMVITMVYMISTGHLAGDGRIEPPNQDANEAAGHLVIGVLACFWLFEKHVGVVKSQVESVVSLLVLVAGMILTGSRGAIFALIVCLFFIVFGLRKGRNILVGLVPIATLLAILFVPAYLLNRITGFASDAKEGKLSKRDQVWAVVYGKWEKTPWLGVGPGNLVENEVDKNISFFSFVAHNTFLEILAEHGVVGFTLFAGFLILLMWRLLIVSKCGGARSDTALVAGAFVSILVSGLSLSLNNGEILWFIFGIVLGIQVPKHQVTQELVQA
jgi:O-antigen ligase